MHERLRILFWKFNDQTITPRESLELEQLLKTPDLEEEAAALLKELWEQEQGAELAFFEPQPGDRVLAMIKEKKAEERPSLPLRRLRWQRVLVAASLLLVMGVGFWAVSRTSKKTTSENAVAGNPVPTIHALPGGDKAVLRLANGKSILLDTAHNGSLAQQGGVQIVKNGEGLLAYSPLLQNAVPVETGAPTLLNTITTPRGGQYRLVLGDGTRVWLNAATELRFPAFFTGNERLVELSGEAYFEVEKDPAKPFRVRLNDRSVVEVLGTHFSISSYADEGVSKTTLVEGAVRVTADEKTTLLKPGEQLTRSSDGVQRLDHRVNTEQVLAWKNGLFDFSNAELRTIAPQLERWYQVEISLEGAVASRHISGIISRNNNLKTVLEVLEFSGGIRSRREGTKLILY